jgi:hypothetical protein
VRRTALLPGWGRFQNSTEDPVHLLKFAAHVPNKELKFAGQILKFPVRFSKEFAEKQETDTGFWRPPVPQKARDSRNPHWIERTGNCAGFHFQFYCGRKRSPACDIFEAAGDPWPDCSAGLLWSAE